MSRSGYISIDISAAKRADTVARGLALTKRQATHGETVDFYDEAARWYVDYLEQQRELAERGKRLRDE